MASKLETYIVYEKLTGKLLHISAFSYNDAVLKAVSMLPAKHDEIRKLEVERLENFTTIQVRVPKPQLVNNG